MGSNRELSAGVRWVPLREKRCRKDAEMDGRGILRNVGGMDREWDTRAATAEAGGGEACRIRREVGLEESRSHDEMDVGYS